MKLISENEPFVAAVGGPFTAKFAVVDGFGQVKPIEGIATAFLRSPRDAEGYTLGFGDQVSFDAENMDADKPDVDGKLQVTFQIPRYAITGPTETTLDLSVLALGRTTMKADVVNQSFPMTLTLPEKS